MNTPKIEAHQYDGVKSSLHTGKLLPGERAYASPTQQTGGAPSGAALSLASILLTKYPCIRHNITLPQDIPETNAAIIAWHTERLAREMQLYLARESIDLYQQTATLHAQLGEAEWAEQRIKELELCLHGLLGLEGKDTSAPKLKCYFDSARQLLTNIK